jgi:hypothetical protein
LLLGLICWLLLQRNVLCLRWRSEQLHRRLVHRLCVVLLGHGLNSIGLLYVPMLLSTGGLWGLLLILLLVLIWLLLTIKVRIGIHL